MTFGQTLKQMLTISGVRISNLASELGYDVSYISRWTSDKKLPSLKYNDDLFQKVAAVIVSSSTPPDRILLAKSFQLDLPAPIDPTALEKSLAEQLTNAYISSNDTIPMSNMLSGVSNNAVVSSLATKTVYQTFAETIGHICNTPDVEMVNCITYAAIHQFYTEDNSFFDPIYGNTSISKPLIMHQMVDMKDFKQYLDIYCEAICKFLSHSSGIVYEVYDAGSMSQNTDPVIILENGLFFQYLTNPCTGTKYSLFSFDKAFVYSVYSDAERRLKTFRKLYKYRLLSRLIAKQFFFQYLMSGNLRLLLCCMYPLNMEKSQLEDLLKREPLAIEQGQTVDSFLCSLMEAPKRVVILKSALISYINDGQICLIGRRISINREDRLRHLRNMIHAFRNNTESRLTIINDETPLLSFGEMRASVFLSDGAAFSENVSSDCENGFVQFKSLALIEGFNEFFSHLESMEGKYALSGESALDFVERGLEML